MRADGSDFRVLAWSIGVARVAFRVEVRGDGSPLEGTNVCIQHAMHIEDAFGITSLTRVRTA